MKIAFLGATRGMGRALARRLAERGDSLFLLGRKPEDLEASAADLRVRAELAGGQVAGSASCDLLDPSTFDPALEAAERELGGLDLVITTGGVFATQEEYEQDAERTGEMLTINFVNTVLFCEAARRRLLARGGGTLVAFSSVAGERGRKPVLLYGAGKAGLTRYLEGLDHKYRSQGLKIVCVKPGFVRTTMTHGLSEPPFAGEPDEVAQRVIRAIDRGAPVVYAPAPWAFVMFVIRLLPRFVMRRVGF